MNHAEKFVREFMVLHRNEISLENKIMKAKHFCWQSENQVRKRKVYKMEVVIQNSAIKGYFEFHVKLLKDLKMLVLLTPIVLITRLIL